jgi:TetR/AcrR family transcriptional repressor of nem operon
VPAEKRFDIDQTLDTAMKLFWALGYDATSMQALLSEMGINRGSLYATYGDKRTLFIAALRRYDRRRRKQHLDSLEKSYTPKNAIRTLFEGWTEIAVSDPGKNGCFLTNTGLEMAARDGEIGAIVAASQEDTEGFFRRLIEAGQACGEIPVTLDSGRTARALLASLLGLLVLARSRPQRPLMDSITEAALETLE